MVKNTSLVERPLRWRSCYTRPSSSTPCTYQTIPLLIVASLSTLIIVSVAVGRAAFSRTKIPPSMSATTPLSADMLKIRGLSKSYGTKRVLRDIDLDVPGPAASRRHHRSVRIRQKHVALLHQPSRTDRQWQDLGGRGAGRLPRAQRQALRTGGAPRGTHAPRTSAWCSSSSIFSPTAHPRAGQNITGGAERREA